MNQNVRAAKLKARTANGVKSKRSNAIVVGEIEGWQIVKRG